VTQKVKVLSSTILCDDDDDDGNDDDDDEGSNKIHQSSLVKNVWCIARHVKN